MTALAQIKRDDALLDALALALVRRPEATLNDLAVDVGIGRTTLYRFCRTREELLARLIDYGMQLALQNIAEAKLDSAPPLQALRQLTLNCLRHREITLFMARQHCRQGLADEKLQDDLSPQRQWIKRLDSFFLRGQLQGVFRIDIPAAALNEIWVAQLIGLVDAEYRGRVALDGLMDVMERVFLQGVSLKDQSVQSDSKSKNRKTSTEDLYV